jgi:hypothetical protein
MIGHSSQLKCVGLNFAVAGLPTQQLLVIKTRFFRLIGQWGMVGLRI